MIQSFIQWCKRFAPYLGISALFFAFVLAIVFFFNYYSPNSVAWVQQLNPYALLIRWDSLHYLHLTMHGYGSGGEVFFPLYPLLMAGFSLFFPVLFSGYAVSFLSLAFALYYLNLLLQENGRPDIKERTIVLLLAFPTAMFFSFIYTESLFLALIVAFFYYLQKRSWLTAALIGFFAALTRNVGIFLCPVYLLSLGLAMYDGRAFGSYLIYLLKKKELWYSLLIPAGLALFCGHTYAVAGDFFAFINGQKAWSQWRTFMWPGATLYSFYKLIFSEPIGDNGLYTLIRQVVFEGGSFLLLAVSTVYWFIKKQWHYATFSVLNVLLFASMFPMFSVNRYVVVVFPLFMFLAEISKKRAWLFYAMLAFFLILFIFNVYVFSIGGWTG